MIDAVPKAVDQIPLRDIAGMLKAGQLTRKEAEQVFHGQMGSRS